MVGRLAETECRSIIRHITETTTFLNCFTLVPSQDMEVVKKLLLNPWNLYIFRHSTLTHKSQILKESTLCDHAGWTMTSKMPSVYLHFFGTESSNSLVEAYVIIKSNKNKLS